MTRKWRSPLDITARQRQNLLAYLGGGTFIFMVVTKFPINPIFGGIVTALLFGQKLIPWGRDEDDEDDQSETRGLRKVASRTTGKTERTRNNDGDMAVDLRWLRLPTAQRLMARR